MVISDFKPATLFFIKEQHRASFLPDQLHTGEASLAPHVVPQDPFVVRDPGRHLCLTHPGRSGDTRTRTDQQRVLPPHGGAHHLRHRTFTHASSVRLRTEHHLEATAQYARARW